MKAEKLKDAYIAGVADNLGTEGMAEAGAMENAKLAGKLGMEVGGEQAGIPLALKLLAGFGAYKGIDNMMKHNERVERKRYEEEKRSRDDEMMFRYRKELGLDPLTGMPVSPYRR